MGFIERLLSLDGIGTELGIVNSITLVAFVLMAALLGWFVRREYKDIRSMVAPIHNRDVADIMTEHDEMYEEYVYNKRKDESTERVRPKGL